MIGRDDDRRPHDDGPPGRAPTREDGAKDQGMSGVAVGQMCAVAFSMPRCHSLHTHSQAHSSLTVHDCSEGKHGRNYGPQ